MKEAIKKLVRWPWFSKAEAEEDEWQTPTTVLEVVSKAELDQMQDEIINDLATEGVLDPKALFYNYKYIDAKFNERDFDVEGRFTKKADMLDQLYAQGKSEVYAEFSDYEELMQRTIEAGKRLRRAIMALDPETNIPVNECRVEDDSKILKEKFNRLPNQLNWEK